MLHVSAIQSKSLQEYTKEIKNNDKRGLSLTSTVVLVCMYYHFRHS